MYANKLEKACECGVPQHISFASNRDNLKSLAANGSALFFAMLAICFIFV
jgi:hypothetical protein